MGAGLFSLLLVLARAPYTQDLFPWAEFFRTALVVHVDLSVLVWFLAYAGVLWSLNSTDRARGIGWTALALASAGTAILVLAPFLGDAHPLMSNYIPVLQTPVFHAGLLVFALGIGVLAWRSMVAIPRVGEEMAGVAAMRFGLNTATVSVVMALMAFAWSGWALPAELTGKAYYELLFWGGGHMLQFTYTLLMLVAWLWLASASGVELPVSPRVVLVFFALGLVTVFLAPPIYYAWEVTSVEHHRFFTWQMQYGGSLATLPLGLAILYGLSRSRSAGPHAAVLRGALVSSMVLFGTGGVIGFLISGSNVTIPAHYHGSIIG
ncbi:MAG: cytochrome C oxidase subunit I, partial [Gammaproteobacteria bacterium]|nr:cytochrome C oxidase subunit I [Gammaproteobacteria bacterium]